MINWGEIKHIHVIRKLEDILSAWFNTAILVVDNHGHIRNMESKDEFHSKNLLCQLISQSSKGMGFLEDFTRGTCDNLKDMDENTLVLEGPLPGTCAIVAKIQIDHELLGCVIAWPYLEEELTSASRKKLEAATKDLKLNKEDIKNALDKLHAVDENNVVYLQKLVELVAQEIETFHQEITMREERINALNKELGTRYRYNSMIGKSRPMQELYSLLDKIKTADSTAMIYGENGTGKELIAKAIHYNSERKDRQMLSINCSAFNENILDSELFGHVRGSFTGAVKDKKGLFEAADGGTLFLDEIGDMSPSMQVKLLRVLQESTILPVGSVKSKKVDVRVITATNKDLAEMIENNLFREDLYYRLNVININVPALRDRKDDIPLLVDHFMEKGCKEKGFLKKRLAKRALEKILDYHWPGNVRELENEMERLLVLSGDERSIVADLLSPRIKVYGEHEKSSKASALAMKGNLKDAVEALEKRVIQEGLRRVKWNKSKLAKELGISRAGLIMKVEKYKLDKRKLAPILSNKKLKKARAS